MTDQVEEREGDGSFDLAGYRRGVWVFAFAALVLVALAALLVALDDDGGSSGALADCGGPGQATATLDGLDYPTTTVRITDADGETEQACVMVADTPIRRQHGLMRVTDFGRHDGMVFTYDVDSTGAFWMFNTPTPLSIAWFKADGTLLTMKDMEPCAMDPNCPQYDPGGAYRYALEVPKGRLGDYGVKAGSKIEVLPPPA